MAAQKATATALPTASWGDKEVQVIGGVDLMDKAELVGKPFMITAYKVTVNERAENPISYVWLEFELEPNGTRYQFNDASTGVRQQMDAWFVAQDLKPALDEWYDAEILAPRGLRFSEYDTKDSRGKAVRGKTFYLTGLGKRG